MLSHGNISVAGSDQQLRQKFFPMHIQLRNPYIQALSLILPQFSAISRIAASLLSD